MANAVVKKEEAALPAEMMDLIVDTAGEGIDFEASDLQIPFIRVAQGTSLQLKKSDSKYMPDLRQGDIYNTVSGQIWDGEEGITVIPCYQTTSYPEFYPESQGGGYVGNRSPDDPDLQRTERKGAKEFLPNGNEVIKTDQYYSLILGEDGDYNPAIVDFKSTGLKVSRRWKTQMTMQKIKDSKGVMRIPALFSTIWKLTVVEESKTVDGSLRTWNNWHVEKVGFVQDRKLLDAAIKFRKSVEKGEAKAVSEESPTVKSPAQQMPGDDDVPF